MKLSSLLAVCIFALVPLATLANTSWQPLVPTRADTITVTVDPLTEGDILHWAMVVDDDRWTRPLPVYRPEGSILYGNAVRNPFQPVEGSTAGVVTLGPFNDPAQVSGAIVFAVLRADGEWDNNRGEDYLIPISQGRIAVETVSPGANDVVVVTVHDSVPGGLLRWGVNSQRELWTPVDPVYWPEGTVMSDDGIGVDSPLPDPDASGRSVIRLGPFNRGEQIVKTLHMAVHWDGDWDTDGGRNYNATINWRDSEGLRIVSPSAEAVAGETLRLEVEAAVEGGVEFWLNGQSLGVKSGPEYVHTMTLVEKPFGPHVLAARAIEDGRVLLDEVLFWHVPSTDLQPVPEGVGFGATEHADGTVTFVLYAPGKKFVSLVGDFNEWDVSADRMHASPDGSWWITRELPPGRYRYMYDIDGSLRLGDPYAREVDWTNERGEKGWLPRDARTVLRVGEAPFAWSAPEYQRPALDALVIYELYIEDFAPGEGFDGITARLDYIQELGFNAIEPLPWHPWTGKESWGYNPAFHLAVEQLYGPPEALKRMINEAHKRGMAVIIDMVLNHAEWNSPLYQLYARDYEASPYFRAFSGHNWGFPKIDQESPAVKRYVADVIRFWIEEYRIDGFRYDATRWTGWQGYNDWGASWFAYAARQADAGSIQIAEHLPIEPPLINDTEMDTGWHAEYRWRIREMITRAELYPGALKENLDGREVGFNHSFQRIPYTESHDEERVMRDLIEAGFEGDELFRRALLAIAIPLMTPGVPMIYAGQEFGEFTPKRVGWNPLQWSLLEQEANRRLHEQTKSLVRLRVDHPALRGENLDLRLADGETGLAVFARDGGEDKVVVAMNFGRAAGSVMVTLDGDLTWQDVLGGDTVVAGDHFVEILPGDVRVWATVR